MTVAAAPQNPVSDIVDRPVSAPRRGGSSTKAVINIHLDGGPPQMDTIDPKPDAPPEIRGEFAPIATVLPGFQVTELMPKVAGLADRFAFIRSLVGSAGRHDAFQCQSGFRKQDLAAIGGRPAMGCVVSKLRGAPTDPVPPFVDLMQGRPLVRNSARPGFLGPAYGPIGGFRGISTTNVSRAWIFIACFPCSPARQGYCAIDGAAIETRSIRPKKRFRKCREI